MRDNKDNESNMNNNIKNNSRWGTYINRRDNENRKE